MTRPALLLLAAIAVVLMSAPVVAPPPPHPDPDAKAIERHLATAHGFAAVRVLTMSPPLHDTRTRSATVLFTARRLGDYLTRRGLATVYVYPDGRVLAPSIEFPTRY